MENKNDPFFRLQYIGFCRSKLGDKTKILGVDDESMLQYIKWQICKARNVLFNDPIWDRYTPEELMIEYFAISFDEDPELCESFEAKLLKGSVEDDVDWMNRMAKQHNMKPEPVPEEALPEEFEEKFD